ncbi:hypothetical protein PSTT_12093 [Puccinia striiformis]|uniref:Uncharacterized protein n=1 Tax=Puccinia striiformis TaxID=27350 RepID=A0A2S4UXJ7_9BASI|nr:hypothetical protein PSTT_12093 [Puccinia striiformis]
MVRIPLNILARGSSVGTQQTAGTTPGPDQDPPNATSPLVSDPLASLLASPVLDPIHWVELTTNFKLYIADRNRARRRIWRPHSPADKFTIILPTGPGRPSFAEFHVLVANRCNDAWAVTVRGTKEYKKATLINTEHLYNTWVNLLHRQKQTEATLDLKMANPTAAERRAHNKSLLTRQTLARAATTARAQNSQNRDNDDVEVSDVEGEDFDAVNVHVNRLYALHRFDATYDRDFPVYIDPGNTRRYILLTVGNCQIWARALLQQEQGVSLHSPPRSLSVHSHAIRDMESIIEILDANGLTSYTLFKSSHLTNDALAALNINLGVVTSLRTNVARYKRYLILNQPINVPASHSTPSSSALTLTS